jgi:hypothetical protein
VSRQISAAVRATRPTHLRPTGTWQDGKVTDFRAVFDARISFINGGSLSTDGFRLDLPSAALGEDEIGRLLVQHLGLALVGEVRLENLRIVEEQHRGSRGVQPLTAVATADYRFVELSHTIREGMVTLPGIPSPVIRPHLTREQAVERYAPGTTFVLDVIDLAGNTGTYLDTPFHRYEGGSDLAATRLETLVDLPAEVFHVTDSTSRGVPASAFFDRELHRKAVLVHTGGDALRRARVYGRRAVLDGRGRRLPRLAGRRARRHRRAEHR